MAIDRFLNEDPAETDLAADSTLRGRLLELQNLTCVAEAPRKRKLSIFDDGQQPVKYVGLSMQAESALADPAKGGMELVSRTAAATTNAMVQTTTTGENVADESETKVPKEPTPRPIKKPVGRLHSVVRNAAKLTGVFMLGGVAAVVTMAGLPDGFFAVQ
jgi:hypothetical protein